MHILFSTITPVVHRKIGNGSIDFIIDWSQDILQYMLVTRILAYFEYVCHQKQLCVITYYHNTKCISYSVRLHQWSAEKSEMGPHILLQTRSKYIIVYVDAIISVCHKHQRLNQRELCVIIYYHNTKCISYSLRLQQWSTEKSEMGPYILLQTRVKIYYSTNIYYNINTVWLFMGVIRDNYTLLPSIVICI